MVWHGYRGGEKAAFEKVADTFNKANAGKIKVSTLAVPYDAFADKITAAVPRGKGPNVFIFAQDRLGGWVAAATRSSRSTSSSIRRPRGATSRPPWTP